MATFVSSTVENCKEKPVEYIDLNQEKDTSCDPINNHDKKENHNGRCIFYKKPIKKYNYKLEFDFDDTPQGIRRQRMLYYQKQNRQNSFNAIRGLIKEICNPENEMDIEEEQIEEMEVDPTTRHSKLRQDYGRMLMLSEWMLEVPQDFSEKWIMVPCPEGKRVILIAHQGITKVYSRRGKLFFTCKTILPGGSPKSNRNSCSILDCIWLEDKEILYALDVLAWSNQEMLNCEAEFRFYWLKSQIEDLPELKEKTEINNCIILRLPNETCDHDFYECLEKTSVSFPLDGLLFFHKEGHYTSGKTPLVTWLKPFMLPEVFGMNIPELNQNKPDSYINFENHVLKVMEKEQKKIGNKNKRKKLEKNQNCNE